MEHTNLLAWREAPMLVVVRYVLLFWGTVARERRELVLENIALRHQLEVLTRPGVARRCTHPTVCSGLGSHASGRTGGSTS